MTRDRKDIKDWTGFLRVMVLTWVVCLSTYMCFYIGMDPYDRFFFKQDKPAQTIALADRYLLPSLVRKAYFDSVIIGTSTVKLLKPEQLNRQFNGRFVNLAMASATPYEQMMLLEEFLKHHPRPKYVFIALDVAWFQENPTTWNENFHFPTYLFEENLNEDFKNAFSLFNLKNSFKKLLAYLRIKPHENRFDGYECFVPPLEKYNLKKAREHIYNQQTSMKNVGFQRSDLIDYEGNKKDFSFPQQLRLKQLLAKLPQETVKVLFLVPYHVHLQSNNINSQGARWKAFKYSYGKLALNFANTHVIDFMIHSPMTENDEHYWDALHYTQTVAEQICDCLYQAVTLNRKEDRFTHIRSFKSTEDMQIKSD